VSHQDDANLKVIISRIQQRRGLKQDLPQPLRPGEIGFATDSRQIYIGADTSDPVSNNYNKTVVFETTQNAQDSTIALANSQILKFEVPHIRFPKGSNTFDGVSKSASWRANTSSTYTISTGASTTRETFGNEITGNTSSIINQNISNQRFQANDIKVIIDGVAQTGDNDGTNANVNAAFDYNFVSGNVLSDDHTLYMRTAPTNSQDVSITYYGNTQVIHLLTASGIVTNGSSTQGFYTAKGIEDWQQLNHEYILVNDETGTGWLGLETKHLDVVAGLGSGSVSNVSLITAGGVIGVKNPLDQALFGGSPTYNASTYTGTVATATANTTAITFNTGSTVLDLNGTKTTGTNSFIWVEGTSPSSNTAIGWLNQKLLPISSANASTTFTVDVPANAFVSGQTVNNVTISGSDLVVDITGLSGSVSNGDKVKFNGNAEIGSSEYIVDNASSTSFTVPDPGLSANITTGLTFINFKTNTGEVQLYSQNHGFANGDSITVSGSDDTAEINDAAFTVSDSQTNTFVITPTSAVGPNTAINGTSVAGSVSPELPASIVSGDNMVISPGRYISLSGETTLNGAIQKVNTDGDWIKMSLIPDSTDKTYVRSSDQKEYLLFNDPADGISTWANVGIDLSTSTNNRYLKQNTTVKAKLEEWLEGLFADQGDRHNILSNVYVNSPFVSSTFGTYNLDVNSTTGEIDFDGHEESGNFSEIVNKLYFDKTDSNIKGLATIKTNIELLTTEAQEARSSTIEYSEPNELLLDTSSPNTEIVVSSLGTDSSIIDTMMFDYVLDARMPGGDFYNKVGTLQYVANPLADGGNGSVVINDIGTEFADTGVDINDGVKFTGAISSGTVSISSNISLSPTPSNVTMKYITRRWKSY
jgi:hypothetical protein